ncbi:MAG: transglycosylase SLT domain-containing protein [Verrucomicrobiota bacterium]
MVYDYLVTQNREAFLARVVEISAKLGISPDWLMVIMKMESSLNPAASNSFTGATGLIQFMPATAAGLGTSTTALKAMTNVEQLEYVYKYFQPYAGRLTSVADLYTVTFFPRALGKSDDYILQTDTITAARIAGQNPAYDINKDLQITAGELRDSISARIPSGMQISIDKAADYLKKK